MASTDVERALGEFIAREIRYDSDQPEVGQDESLLDGTLDSTDILRLVFFVEERFGLHVVPSPRHADCLLVTGPVTRNMAEALRRTWEATPDPKLVVAVGDCARDGGIFRGSYAIVGGVGDVVPVDAVIPGCPPSPAAILAGLLDVLGRRR